MAPLNKRSTYRQGAGMKPSEASAHHNESLLITRLPENPSDDLHLHLFGITLVWLMFGFGATSWSLYIFKIKDFEILVYSGNLVSTKTKPHV